MKWNKNFSKVFTKCIKIQNAVFHFHCKFKLYWTKPFQTIWYTVYCLLYSFLSPLSMAHKFKSVPIVTMLLGLKPIAMWSLKNRCTGQPVLTPLVIHYIHLLTEMKFSHLQTSYTTFTATSYNYILRWYQVRPKLFNVIK